MVKMVLLMVVVEMVVKMFVVTMVVKVMVVAGGSYIGSVHNVCGVTVLLMMLMVWWL